MRIIKFIDKFSSNEIYCNCKNLLSNFFSFSTQFSFSPIELTNSSPSKLTNLSSSYSIKIKQSGKIYISVFHNLFYPNSIYNKAIEEIEWSLKSTDRIICSGKVTSGHNFQFDESLIYGSNGAASKSFSEIKYDLYQKIVGNLEELNKHFFHFEIDLSDAEGGAKEFELKFDFHDFKPGCSVNDVKLSFNNVVPAIDVICKKESFSELDKGFNLLTLRETERSDFIGISSVFLKNKNNRVEQIGELDLENIELNASSYKLLSTENYPDKEQELLYLKNYIPLPFDKSDKLNLLNKIKDFDKTGQKLNNDDVLIIEKALDRNFAEKSDNSNRIELVINNCFEDKAEVMANYYFDTSSISQSKKQIFLDGYPVDFESINIEFENRSKVTASTLSSQFDFYHAACEFFGFNKIQKVFVKHKRDFSPNGIWEASLAIQIIFSKSYNMDFSQWTLFIAICRNRCLYADIEINFSFSVSEK